jgi:predicted dehydrogenase
LIASLKSKIDYDKVQLLNKKKLIGSTDVDLDSYVELKFENDFKSTIGASFLKNLGNQTRIIGTGGELIIEDTWTANISTIRIKKNGAEKIINIDSNENIYSYEIEKLSQCILDGKTKVDFPGLTIDQIIGNMKIIDKWLN